MQLLYFREIAARLAGYLHVSCLFVNMIPVFMERIEQILAIRLGNHGHRIACRVLKQGPDCFEGRLFGREVFVYAQFIVCSAARTDTYRPVVAEDQALPVPLTPFAENPRIFQPAFLLPDHLDAGQLLVRKNLARFALEDVLLHLPQLLHALAPQLGRIVERNLAARTSFQCEEGEQTQADKPENKETHVLNI